MTAERKNVPESTVLNQRRAADPEASAWVSANAGAGKTKVLTDRVLRLLLTGVPPGRILCLTFTKAAAATMMIRAVERLGRWVTLGNSALADELRALTGERPDKDTLRRARRLFARAVETPGGLKIETIHAFCERVLHMVPFEAGVPARFAVLDEAQSAEIVAEATARVFAAASDETGALRCALDVVSVDAVGDELTRVIGAALNERAFLELGVEAGIGRLRRALDLAPGESVPAIERAMLEDGIPTSEWQALADTLGCGKATDRDRAAALRAALAVQDFETRLAHYLSAFFTKENAPLADASLCTKAIDAEVKARLLAERDRLAALEDRRRSARALERSTALFILAAAIHDQVEAAKAARSALDFDDLIQKTLALLRGGQGPWVLYKLDAGIDHMLVDEAQDTNPDQWEILRLLADEFTAGRSIRPERVRTFFAVGDPKQSIYGFQGAEPRKFEEHRQHWRRKTRDAQLRFEDVPLTLSFRSADAVLRVVDDTFAVESNFDGLSFAEDAAIGTVHESARPDARGTLELWPLVAPKDGPEDDPEAWKLPVDQPSLSSPAAMVARNVAQAVRSWTTLGDERGRVWRPGEILILVRRRGPAFEAVIRELKRLEVPVAGADRLDVGAHIAVLDLVAAGRAALLPQDDLTLATALKSPLVGLDDDDLVRIVAGRAEDESLVSALACAAAAGDRAAAAGKASLEEWRRLARSHGPFGFYAALLGPGEGRKRLVARLRGEAADALDVFLGHAHASELVETPSLATFLDRFVSAPHQFKRELDETLDEVRVMTVHGAKGLEAPLVIVIEGCDDRAKDCPLLPLGATGDGGPLPVWSPGKTHDSARIKNARDDLHERGRQERNRLLYVAMTRAADRLVIAPYRTRGQKTPADAWCAMIRCGLDRAGRALVPAAAPYGEGQVDTWSDDDAPPRLAAAPRPAQLELAFTPDWLTKPVEPDPEPDATLRPSHAVVHRQVWPARTGSGAEARLRGVMIHALLQRLPTVPAERRESVAGAYVRARAPKLDGTTQARIAADALGVLRHGALTELFGPHSRAEVAITGRLRHGLDEWPVSGQIDRFCVLEDEVLLADFKSHAQAPDPAEPLPQTYVAQLALYSELLREIYPGRRIRPFLIWTSGPSVRELSQRELESALDLVTPA